MCNVDVNCTFKTNCLLTERPEKKSRGRNILEESIPQNFSHYLLHVNICLRHLGYKKYELLGIINVPNLVFEGKGTYA